MSCFRTSPVSRPVLLRRGECWDSFQHPEVRNSRCSQHQTAWSLSHQVEQNKNQHISTDPPINPNSPNIDGWGKKKQPRRDWKNSTSLGFERVKDLLNDSIIFANRKISWFHKFETSRSYDDLFCNPNISWILTYPNSSHMSFSWTLPLGSQSWLSPEGFIAACAPRHVGWWAWIWDCVMFTSQNM